MTTNTSQNTAASRAVRSKLAPIGSTTNRSRVSNGAEILPGVDQRLAIARRYRDLVAAIAIDQGGHDRCSEARMQLIRRFASGAVLAEELESRLVRGEAVDISEHALLSSTLVRLAQRIGINRVARDVTVDPLDYVRAVTRKHDDHDEDAEVEE